MRPEILLHDAELGQWLKFKKPLDTVTACRPADVRPALRQVEALVEKQGLFAAGFVCYEAAPAFDPACTIHSFSDLPLLLFGIYQAPEVVEFPGSLRPRSPLVWQPDWDCATFTRAVAEIHAAIASGETYQVNLTFPLAAPFSGDPLDFFYRLVRGQRAGYAAYIDLGRQVICSASPELFFRRDGNRLVMRPMKGTIVRGLTSAADLRQAEQLRHSAKDRAENIMILDMVRNDLGRLAPPGKVHATELCGLEKYPTVWQMTSTVEAETSASFEQIMAALFPCASITGAPKYRTMDIIARLEQRARGIYTGSIGYLAPQRRAQFSVAIRTALIDLEKQQAHYGVGAGVTWDSIPAVEYRECLAKARILSRPMPDFDLFETLLWSPRQGYFLLEEHLARLTSSADYFDYPCDPAEVQHSLQALALTLPAEPQRIRLLLSASGRLRHEATSYTPDQPEPARLKPADKPIDRSNPFLYHKTTARDHYAQARGGQLDCDDVILWNDRGEITETIIANIVADLDGELVTPPIECGLLAGTFRSHLLAQGTLLEKRLTFDDLQRCRRIYLINALRRWRRAVIVKNHCPTC